jgi:hypothetical protein
MKRRQALPDDNFFSRTDPAPRQTAKLRVVPPGPLVLQAASLRDPTKIPPREWLYGTQLIRGFVTVLVAPGGTGKSAYAMAVAMAIASGEKFLREHIFASGPTAVLNLEDPLDELDRREAAIRIRHHLDHIQLADRFYMHSGEMRSVTVAALDGDGFTVVYPDEEAIITQITEHGIVLLVVDPYAESHSLEENSNPDMVKAAAAWRRIARATNCAVLLVHHVRKGAVTDIDAARGAKALTDSARVGLILSPMSADEAEEFRIPELERWAYVRLDDAKVNLAPKAAKARWFRLEQVELGNGTDAYPKGDKVAAMAVWTPPTPEAEATPQQLNEVLDIINEPPAGWLYSPTRQGRNNTRWAGQVLVDQLDFSDKQANALISAWLKSGLLYRESFRDEHRNERTGVRVDASKRPTP